MNEKSSRIAVVTGGSGGIGGQAAKRLTEEGNQVVIVGRDTDKGEAFAQSISNGARACFIQCDVTSKEQVDAMAAEVAKRFGGASIIVNAAGTLVPTSVLDTTAEQFDMAMNSNVRAALLVCQALVPFMIEQRYGRVINISSVLKDTVAVDRGIYGASKAALARLTMSMALEWGGFGVTANIVAPGPVWTNMAADSLKDDTLRNTWTSRTARGELAQPEDLGGLIAFLAREEARHINGQQIRIDGGYF